jgi:hypothetical protein
MGMNIWITSNDIMVNTASIIESFTQHWSCSIKWSLRICSTWFESITFTIWWNLFLLLLLIILLCIIVRHPMNRTLYVFSISWLSHHHIINLLLWSGICWWFITYIICFVSWEFFCFNISSIQFTRFS